MFDPSNLFHSLLLIPILNVLIGLYKLMSSFNVPSPLGISLILLTALIKLILYPLTSTQVRSALKLNKLKPELDKLSEKHKGDKQRLLQEQARLYKEAGVNPAAGCLPLLLQMPILIALYNLFLQLLTSSDVESVIDGINKVVYFSTLKISSLDLNFFGLNLTHKPSQWQEFGWWLLLIPVATALFQYWQTRLISVQPHLTSPNIDKKRKKDKEKKEDMAQTMQKQMAIMMPLMIGFFAYSFPLGLSIYWNTFTIFGIIQQYHVSKKT